MVCSHRERGRKGRVNAEPQSQERRVVLQSTIRNFSDLPESEAARLPEPPEDIAQAMQLVAVILERLATANMDHAKTREP